MGKLNKFDMKMSKWSISSFFSSGFIFIPSKIRHEIFEISCRVLLGIKMTPEEKKELMDHFDIFMSNLFSLPIKIPGLGLYKVRLKSAIYKMI
jgi:hypothetical protein